MLVDGVNLWADYISDITRVLRLTRDYLFVIFQFMEETLQQTALIPRQPTHITIRFVDYPQRLWSDRKLFLVITM